MIKSHAPLGIPRQEVLPCTWLDLPIVAQIWLYLLCYDCGCRALRRFC